MNHQITSKTDLVSMTSHNKAECPHPKVFTGTCNSCGDEGHPAALCPNRGPIVCKNCKEEGTYITILGRET